MAVKSSKYLHQSSSTSENAVKGTEASVTASDCELPEWFGCQVDSESIAPSRIVGCVVHVPSQSKKRSGNHSVRVRLWTRRSRAELMMKSETVNPKHERGERKAGSEQGHGNFPGPRGRGRRMVVSEAHGEKTNVRRNAFTNFTGVPRNPRKLARELMAGNREKCIIQRYDETPGSSECLGALSRHTTTRRARFERPINPNATDVTPVIPSVVEDPSPTGNAASIRQQHATQLDTSKHAHQAVGLKSRAEVNPMFSSAKRAHAIHPPVAVAWRDGDDASARRCDGGAARRRNGDRVGAKWHKESQFDVGELCRQDQHGSMSEYCW